MALEVYRKKRDFAVTPEPRGGRVAKRRGKKLAFFVQKHAARRLHYDFRLELDGVLLSWAVPKGPSLDPRDKRLAVHVEDHPMEYGDFEGVIPAKQYGAGAVLLWDRGTWHPVEDAATGYARGKLKFVLEGEKLRGGFTLVRTHGRYAETSGDAKPWLLIKEDDEHARSALHESVVEAHPNSVTSGRSIAEIAADPDREWHSNRSVAENVKQMKKAPGRRRSRRAQAARVAGAVVSELPQQLEPQLATLVKDPPTGERWLHEMKHDGYRMLCRIADGGEVRIVSRSGRDWTETFAAIARLVQRLPLRSAWLDGEIVVLDREGRSSFQALQNALSGGRDADFAYFLFDLPYLDGHDLRAAPLLERKRLLESLLEGAPEALRYSAHVVGSGPEFFARACELGVEGAVAKRIDGPYAAGRGRDWVKIKCSRRQEMVIVGYTDATSGGGGFGALHLGIHQPDGTLRYAGKVGTGFTAASASSLQRKLEALAVAKPQLANPPGGAEARRSHWVRPELVAEVEFTEWTDDGTLRHPSFKGLRADKAAADVVEERPQETPRDDERTSRAKRKGGDVVAGIAISNPEKLLYPDAGLAKRDLALFYETIGDWILPHVRSRPLTLVRCPNGWQEKCFYQKSAAGSHPALDSVEVRTSEGPAQYLVANSVAAIVATLQMGALELHPWGSTSAALYLVDRITFDIDPDDDLAWDAVVEAAIIVRTLLEKLGLESFPKTTGGKGLHVVLPVMPTLGWEDTKGFCKTVADLLCQTFPDRFTPSISKASRRGRIFIDYLRNAEGATAVAAYSLRARANAPVSTPIAWSELARRDLRFDHFNVKTVPRRLARAKGDPWKDFFAVRQAITPSIMEQVGFVPGSPASRSAAAKPRGRWRR